MGGVTNCWGTHNHHGLEEMTGRHRIDMDGLWTLILAFYGDSQGRFGNGYVFVEMGLNWIPVNRVVIMGNLRIISDFSIVLGKMRIILGMRRKCLVDLFSKEGGR